jgi:LmbE family N-acetylglucosaminyl deacetylase
MPLDPIQPLESLLSEGMQPGRGPRALRDLIFPAPLAILVLAPHPDDFDAIGLTLRHLHRQGHAVEVGVLTTGASGVEDGFAGAHDAAAKSSLREAEQRESGAFFGLPAQRLHFLRLWDDPGDEAADLARLQAWIADRPADLLFMPHGNDSNLTHRRTFQAVCAIAANLRLQTWACLNQDAKTLQMRVDLFHEFGEEEAAWKARLLRLHGSQQARNLRTRGTGFDARVLELNRRAAQALGTRLPYAEAFELMRIGPPRAIP